MHPLEYLAIALYCVSVVRCLSYGAYCIKSGKGGGFALSLALAAVSGVLFYGYMSRGV